MSWVGCYLSKFNPFVKPFVIVVIHLFSYFAQVVNVGERFHLHANVVPQDRFKRPREIQVLHKVVHVFVVEEVGVALAGVVQRQKQVIALVLLLQI